MSKKLHKIVSEFRTGLLGGGPSDRMCYAVCAPLAGYLRTIGFDVEMVEGEVDVSEEYVSGHFWLRLPDGRIIDPTADQFSTPERPMPEVYIGALPGWYDTEFTA